MPPAPTGALPPVSNTARPAPALSFTAHDTTSLEHDERLLGGQREAHAGDFTHAASIREHTDPPLGARSCRESRVWIDLGCDQKVPRWTLARPALILPTVVRRGFAQPVGCLLFALAACTSTSSKSCGNHKCPAPVGPSFAVRVSVDGGQMPTRGARRTQIKIGRPTHISVSIERASGADVRDVYLVVNSYPSGIDRGRPSGRVKILAHHVASLGPNDTVQAVWTPTPLFGTTNLDVGVDFAIGNEGVGWPAGTLQLVP